MLNKIFKVETETFIFYSIILYSFNNFYNKKYIFLKFGLFEIIKIMHTTYIYFFLGLKRSIKFYFIPLLFYFFPGTYLWKGSYEFYIIFFPYSNRK